MENVVAKLYFKPVDAHQYWPAKLISEEEQPAQIAGVLRLGYYYVDTEGLLCVMVVFRRADDYHPDRVLAYQAIIAPADKVNDPLAAVPSVGEAAGACEEYWKANLAKVFGA